MVTNWDYTGSYLDQFPAKYKGAVGNEFCVCIREGAQTPYEVISKLWGRIGRNRTELRGLIAETLAQPEASKYAAFLLERESMPYEDRVKLKEASHREGSEQHIKRFMATVQPTDKQLKFLQRLGVSVIPRTRLEASQLIEDALHGNIQDEN